MINMTDGLPWPWKAIAQTVMQFVLQAEVRRDLPAVSLDSSYSRDIQCVLDQPKKIQDLLNRIASRIEALASAHINQLGARTALEHSVHMFLRFVVYSTWCED